MRHELHCTPVAGAKKIKTKHNNIARGGNVLNYVKEEVPKFNLSNFCLELDLARNYSIFRSVENLACI